MVESDPLKRALELAREGKKEEARALVAGVLRDDPDRESGWALLYYVAKDEREVKLSIQQVLRINPESEWAKERLEEGSEARSGETRAGRQTWSDLTTEQKTYAIGCIGILAIIVCLCLLVYVPSTRDREVTPTSTAVPTEVEATAIPIVPPTAAIAPRPQATSCDCSHDAYNCPDFGTRAEAQTCFEFCGGVSNDVHGLDRDGDGEACESS